MPKHIENPREVGTPPQEQTWSKWADDLASSAKTKTLEALNTPEGQAAAGMFAVAALIATRGKLNRIGNGAVPNAVERAGVRMENWLAEVERPSWIKKANDLTVIKRYPDLDYGMASKVRLSWHGRPEIVDDLSSSWITRITPINPNSTDILKNSGATAIAKFKIGQEMPVGLGVSSKGSIIEKLNEKTGDYLRIKERKETSLNFGIWSLDTPPGTNVKEFFLGNAFRAERQLAQARVLESTAPSGNTFTRLQFQTEKGYHERLAWGDAKGINRRVDIDFCPKQFRLSGCDSGGQIGELVYPRGSIFHTMKRFFRWMESPPKSEGVVSNQLLEKLLREHVLDTRLLERL